MNYNYQSNDAIGDFDIFKQNDACSSAVNYIQADWCPNYYTWWPPVDISAAKAKVQEVILTKVQEALKRNNVNRAKQLLDLAQAVKEL